MPILKILPDIYPVTNFVKICGYSERKDVLSKNIKRRGFHGNL